MGSRVMDGQEGRRAENWVRAGSAGLRVLSTPGQLGLEVGVDAIARAKGNQCRQSRELGTGAVSGTLTVGALSDLHQVREDEGPPGLSSLLCLDSKWDEGLWEAGGQGSSPTLRCDLRLICTPLSSDSSSVQRRDGLENLQDSLLVTGLGFLLPWALLMLSCWNPGPLPSLPLVTQAPGAPREEEGAVQLGWLSLRGPHLLPAEQALCRGGREGNIALWWQLLGPHVTAPLRLSAQASLKPLLSILCV